MVFIVEYKKNGNHSKEKKMEKIKNRGCRKTGIK